MLNFELASDSISLGIDSDGSTVFGMAYYVVATDARGARWRHFHSFVDHIQGYNAEEGEHYWVNRNAEAVTAAERFFERVQARSLIDMEHWVEFFPVYGSEAYQQDGGEDDLIAWEREIDEFGRGELRHVA